MPSPLRFAAALLVALGTLAAPLAATAKEIWEYPWIEARSEHFVVRSAISEEKTRGLVTDLERFRTLVTSITSLRRANERVPTEIYVLPYAESELGLGSEAAGYMVPGMRANYAVMSPQGNASDEVLKHEYVHFLVRNQGGFVLPRWVDEGYAELLMTLSVSEDGARFEYAKARPWMVTPLEYGTWIPFRTVIETRDYSKFSTEIRAMWYAQSWFLMHYLMIGRPGTSFGEELSKFVKLSEDGTAPVPAFEQAFGIEVMTLQRKLAQYGAGRAKGFNVTLTTPLPPVTMAIQPIPADRVATQLAEIAVAIGSLQAAEKYAEAALAQNAENADAWVIRGDLLQHAKRWEDAAPCFERAIALEPKNALHELDFGEFFLGRARAEEDAEKRAQWLVEARRHLYRSYQLDPNDPETLDQNGVTYLVEGGDPDKAIESIEAAHELLPSQTDIQADLARAYVAAHRGEDARPILLRLIAWSEAKENSELEAMLASLDAPAPGAETKADPAKTEPAPAQ